MERQRDVPLSLRGARTVRLRALPGVLSVAVLLAGLCASAAQAAGEPKDTVTFSCTSLTYSFTGFPEASGNTVFEVISIDGEKILPVTEFTFNGSAGSNTVPVSVPAGEHRLDGRAHWNTNGVKGGKDIPKRGGITCAAPTVAVTSITPTSGTTAGGTAVAITGSGFVTGATVTIGGEASEVNVVSEDEITAVTSAHAAGPEEVVVGDINGTSTGGPSYTYLAPPPAPTVTSITPTSGTTAGGTAVTISGSGFLAGATVTIGGEASEVDVVSEDEITATTSAQGAGPEEVVVSDINGTSTGGPSYTYVTPPVPPPGGTGTPGGSPQNNPPANNPTPGSGVLGTITAALPPPVLGVSGDIAPVSGTVLIKLPGSSVFVPLTGVRQVPFGTIIDTTHGRVSVTTASLHGGTQTAIFYGGRFKLLQGRNGLVVAVLTGGNYSVCPTARERSHIASARSHIASAPKRASRKHVVRKLWSEGHGSFSTKGTYAAGAVLGTRWLTEDLCEGTLIHVATDRVAVTNLVSHRHRTVKARHSYLAKAPR